MEREQKRNEVAQLKGTFTSATSAVVLGFKGLKVDKDTAFRKSIREGKGQYRVAKKHPAPPGGEGNGLRVPVRAVQGRGPRSPPPRPTSSPWPRPSTPS